MTATPVGTDRLLAVTLRAQPGWFATAVLAGLCSAAGALVLPAAMGRALDAALAGGHGLVPALTLLAIVIAVGTLADVLGQIAGTAGVAGTTAWLRRRILGNLLGLGLPGQQQYPAGDAVTRLIAGAGSTGRIVSLVLTAVRTAVTALAALVLLFLLDWTLPVTLLGGLLVSVALLRPFTRQATSAFEEYQTVQGRIASRLVDALAGLRTIRASGTVDREVDRVLEPLPELRSVGVHTWLLQRRLAWSFGLLIRLLQLAVLAAAGWAVSAGRLSPGDLVAAVGYAGIALQAIEQIDLFVELVQVRAGAARVRPLTGTPQAAVPRARSEHGIGDVEIRDVTVRLGDRTVLDGCSLRLPAGTTTAVVGGSGAGKSVLVGLLGRLYQPDAGQVLIDGQPVAHLPDTDLRRLVGYAFERPALVGATLADAVGYGLPAQPPATEVPAVTTAAQTALVDGVVAKLPHGYLTQVREAPLSGGERQRVGIARLVAMRPAILVLDDATSSLDTATEVELQAALARTLPGRTKLVVTHRARSAAQADQVAWLVGGRVRALGRHAELWRDADYRALFTGGAEAAR
ncbi:MAG: ATP-binding cassette domain-containing protein [Streptosporangiales bacterium]|nr:ATP-binding cassette domain-containing protein [Streptosporangiales bacterium]